MKEWTEFNWGQISELKYGKGLKGYRDLRGEIPVYGTNGYIGQTEKALCEKDGIIVGRKGAYRGIHYSPVPFYVIDTAFYLVPTIENLDIKFAYYQLLTQDINGLDSGSAIPSTSREDFYRLKLSLPPLQEQKSIASILSALDDKIELNLQMNKTLEEMAMALYKHWFVDFGPFQDGEFVESELGEIPKGWEVKTLEDIIKFSNGYAFKSKQLLKEEEPDCFHIFKMGHILKGGGLKADGTKSWIKKSDCKALDKFILKTGDILMSMTDMKDNMTILGHTALMNEDNKFIVNQRVGLLRVANNYGIDYPYVFLLTNSSDFIQRLRSQANSGVQVNLSTNAIKSAKVVIPNKEVNVKFNNITLPYYESINQNALENQTLTQLRDTLLPKLISGEVRLKDAEKTLSEVL